MSKVVLGADHGGFELKNYMVELLTNEGFEVIDVGTFSNASCDYPDFALALCKKITSGEAQRGILICGSGVGASVAANKVVGIRAGLCHDSYSAHQGVEHDDMNVLCLGQRVIGIEVARELVHQFLKAKFSGEERHIRRLLKVSAIEQGLAAEPQR